MSDKTLKVGAFYWVKPVLDPDREEEWELDYQPARYAGKNAAGEDIWHCLNLDGVSNWPMRWIGTEIVGAT